MRKRKLFTVAVVLQMLLLACSGMQAADLPTAEEVLARMDAVTRGIESGAFLAHVEVPAVGVEIETEVWFDGVRFRVDTRQVWSRPGQEPVTDEIRWVFDGERIIETKPPKMSSAREATPLRLDEVSKYVSLGGMNLLMIWPLAHSVVHGRSLREHILLRADEGLETVGQESIGDDSCVVLSAPQERTPSRFWICPDKDYAVARYEYDREDGRLAVFEVREWMKVGSSWLPRVAVVYNVDQETGERSPGERCEIVSAAFNIPVAEDRFQIQLPEETVRERFADLD